MIRAAVLLAMIANPVAAQVVTAPAGPVSAVDTAARDAAAAAKTTADNAARDAAAAQAAIPTPASATPPSEMIGGQTGSQVRYAREDHTHPRITRAGIVTTDSTGSWSVTWATALPSAPAVLPVPINATAQPVVCNVATRTTTSATGRCWLARTLPATLSLLSALVSYDIFGSAATGISVQVLAIPSTQ